MEHPCRHHDDYAGRYLDVNNLAADAPLNILATNTAPIECVPAIMNLDLLPDMGRMTGRLPSAEWRTPCVGRGSAAHPAAASAHGATSGPAQTARQMVGSQRRSERADAAWRHLLAETRLLTPIRFATQHPRYTAQMAKVELRTCVKSSSVRQKRVGQRNIAGL